MDPNEALERMRRHQKRLAEIDGVPWEQWRKGDTEDRDDALEGIRECAEALDQWLSAGGFLPDAWKRSR